MANRKATAKPRKPRDVEAYWLHISETAGARIKHAETGREINVIHLTARDPGRPDQEPVSIFMDPAHAEEFHRALGLTLESLAAAIAAGDIPPTAA